MAKSSKLYKDSPSLKRGEDGDVGVQKPSEADATDMGLAGETGQGEGAEQAQMPIETHQAHERRETKHRHVHEHLAMHHRHEMEHVTHTGDKKELHKKHEAEHADMHDRHHQEVKTMHKRHEKSAKKE